MCRVGFARVNVQECAIIQSRYNASRSRVLYHEDLADLLGDFLTFLLKQLLLKLLLDELTPSGEFAAHFATAVTALPVAARLASGGSTTTSGFLLHTIVTESRRGGRGSGEGGGRVTNDDHDAFRVRGGQ